MLHNHLKWILNPFTIPQKVYNKSIKKWTVHIHFKSDSYTAK